MSEYIGDYDIGDGTPITHDFTTVNVSGIPQTFTGNPTVAVYKDNNTTETTEGVTLTTNYDGQTGRNHISINIASNPSFYGSGIYSVVVASGNVNGLSIVGYDICNFRLMSKSVYYADINYTVDSANSQDEYTVSWFKNGVPLSSGQILSPTIQVIKRSDGTDLIASTSMQFISTSLGIVKKDETTNRRGNGEAAIAQVQATIDGATRTWRRLFSRDN